ncbi:MAG: DUF418 domain-containing protein, partial [Wenzhouxiangellaceae bacterium]|nr:DUF418 domain-containing protein [Wenzhouxiangellaceae bacterium]
AVWLMIRPDLFQSSNQYWRRVAQTLGAPALMLFYVSTIVLLWQRPAWQERLAPLAPVGRMALTNYLLQSVAGTLVFYGYGLGLINRIGPTTGFLLSLGFFLLQVRFSRWWLARFRFGPAEWLWRTLTYGRRQPWRRGQTAAGLRPLPLLAPLGRRLRRLPPALPLVA